MIIVLRTLNGSHLSKTRTTVLVISVSAVKIQNQLGNIDISNDVIATVVGGAATEIFGIVGMASKNQIRDNLNEILRRDNYSKGVVVRQQEDGVAIDVYIIAGYGFSRLNIFGYK